MASPRHDAPRIDEANQCVWRDGTRINLTPKALAVLVRLRQCPQQLVAKRDLLDAGWPDTHVIEAVLNNAVAQLREALGDDARRPRFIETVHRRGYRWIGPGADDAPRSSPSPTHARDGGIFVGRDTVLAELGRAYASANAGRRQLVFVTGEPGIGKTSVVDHFVRGLEAEGVEATGQIPQDRSASRSFPLLGRGRCIDHLTGGEAYQPVLEAIEGLWAHGDSEVRNAFRTHAPTWLLQIPGLLTVEQREELQRTVTLAAHERMQREIERALDAAGAERTIVLVFEDLHWSDAATISLLWALATRRDLARLLIVATYRPVDAIAQQHPIIRVKHELTSKRQCVELALGGLDVAAVGAFLDHRFPGHRVPQGFAEVLETQTSGNPLFVLNALDDFAQRGWLIERDAGWECTADLAVIGAAVPDSTRDIIAFRLDQLPRASREMLEAASVVGMTFATQAVAAACERSCAEVEAECDRLARAALFLGDGTDVEWPDGSHGRHHDFRHALYRQVLYTRVTPTRRQSLHRRVAERIETGFRDRIDEAARQLSLHYERAGEAFRAAELLETLAKQAYTRCASAEAEALLDHAVEVIRHAPESDARQQRLLQLTIAHGVALASVRGSTSDAAVRRTFEAARALASSISIAPEHVAALGFAAATDILSGRLRQGLTLGRQQLAFAGADAPPALAFNAHGVIGIALLYLGEVDAARSRLESAFEVRVAQGAAAAADADTSFAPMYDPIVQLRMAYGLAETLSGRSERGWSSVMTGIAEARAIGMPAYVGPALSQATGIAIVRGDRVAARACVTELLALCETTGLPLWMEAARVQMGWLAVRETHDAALLAPLAEAVEEFVRNGRLGSPRMFSMLADAHLAVGQREEASRALDQAFDSRGEECVFDAELFRQRAAILLGGSHEPAADSGLAEEFLERAIEVAATQGTRLFGLRSTIDLCRLWLGAGKRRAAQQRLADALAGFDESPDDNDLRLARQLLAQAGRRAPRPDRHR